MLQKNIFICLLGLWLGFSFFNVQAQGKYQLKNPEISFFSKAPLENIESFNADGKGIIDFASNSFSFKIPIKSFQFKKQLMKEHFNENYMESDKYPDAHFKGKIEGNYNLKKNGTYTVNAVGVLTIHGVSQERSIPCQIVVKNGVYSIGSKFQVKLEHHKIVRPNLVYNNIAEMIDVSINSKLVQL